MQVAIDGPASAGKSTVAKLIAAKLAYVYIDTGAMYRACTVIARDQGIAYGDEAAILKAVTATGISFKTLAGKQKVYAGTKDITSEIREPEIAAHVSQVAAFKGIREKLVAMQQKMAQATNVVMDGRDIGTVVLPQADVKIFLVASAHSRAKRRFLDLKEQGIANQKSVTEIEAEITKRDYKDSHRTISPLKKARDAVEIDTTYMTIEQVVAAILTEITQKAKKN